MARHHHRPAPRRASKSRHAQVGALINLECFLCRSTLLPGDHVRPQRLDLLGLEQVAPGRHLVLALGDRVEETRLVVARKGAQVEGALRLGHVRAVAGGAVLLEDLRAGLDALGREGLLRKGAAAGERQKAKADSSRCALRITRQRCALRMTGGHSGIRANVQTDPPRGTFFSASPMRTTLTPPRPDWMETYCRPLCVKVIGCALMPELVWNCHRVLPLSTSSAMNSPVSLPVKSSPPAVAITAE